MNIPFNIHDTVILTLVFIVVNREEDDLTVADFTFQATCLKDEIKETEMNLFGQACDCARAKDYDFEFDVIVIQRHITSL